ncbi:MAG TPA: SRPBCC family protein [Acidimicrobiales bacterium]|nr:SRPBCC family protein [Acidimicrobiales bacterium]
MAKSHRGWHAEAEIDIAAPPERVWAIVSDISRHPALAGSGEVLAVRMNGPLAVGTTFDSDVRTGEVGSFSPRCVIETLDDRRRLGWLSLFPLEEGETENHQIEVHWTFGLEPTRSGTRLAHTVDIPRPKLGADELASFFERTDRLSQPSAATKGVWSSFCLIAEGAAEACELKPSRVLASSEPGRQSRPSARQSAASQALSTKAMRRPHSSRSGTWSVRRRRRWRGSSRSTGTVWSAVWRCSTA